MGRAEARPAPCIPFYCRSAENHIASQGLKGTGSSQEPQAPGQPHTSDQATGRPLRQPYSRYQAPDTSDHAPGMRPARPGPQAGPVLLLASQGACAARRDDSAVAHPGGRLSDWLAGPSSGHAFWRAQVRHRARQALIRASLGLQESVLTQVPN